MFQTHPQINNTWSRCGSFVESFTLHMDFPTPNDLGPSLIHNTTFSVRYSMRPIRSREWTVSFSSLLKDQITVPYNVFQNALEPSWNVFSCDLGEPSFTPYMRVLAWERNQMQRYRNQRFASDYQPVSFAGKRDSSIAFCMRSRTVWGNICLFLYSASTVRKECSY